MAFLFRLCIATLFFGPVWSQGWSCPSDWALSGHDDKPGKVQDAKQFVAVINIFRCMHGVSAVQWDHDVYLSARRWAERTGEAMAHSRLGVYRRSDTGESLAGTTLSSKRPGVDAAQTWYSEILGACEGRAACFQTANASNFAALVWRDVRGVAYANPTGRLAIGRFQAQEGGLAPNTPNEYRGEVPLVIKGYGHCSEAVVDCPAFKGITPGDMDACDVAAEASELHGAWVGKTVYRTKCTDKYRTLARLGLFEMHAHAPGFARLRNVMPQTMVWTLTVIAVFISMGAVALVFRVIPQARMLCFSGSGMLRYEEYLPALSSVSLRSDKGLPGVELLQSDDPETFFQPVSFSSAPVLV